MPDVVDSIYTLSLAICHEGHDWIQWQQWASRPGTETGSVWIAFCYIVMRMATGLLLFLKQREVTVILSNWLPPLSYPSPFSVLLWSCHDGSHILRWRRHNIGLAADAESCGAMQSLLDFLLSQCLQVWLLALVYWFLNNLRSIHHFWRTRGETIISTTWFMQQQRMGWWEQWISWSMLLCSYQSRTTIKRQAWPKRWSDIWMDLTVQSEGIQAVCGLLMYNYTICGWI
jgi:hypothetical protein